MIDDEGEVYRYRAVTYFVLFGFDELDSCAMSHALFCVGRGLSSAAMAGRGDMTSASAEY